MCKHAKKLGPGRNSSRKPGFFPTITDMSDWREPLFQSKDFSYCSLFKASFPGIISGSALLSIGKYLPFIIAAHVTPVGLTLLMVAGGFLLAYGMLQGLKYATTRVLKEGFTENIEDCNLGRKSALEQFFSNSTFTAW